ncbi:hypothetical protein ABTY20_22955 [Streptomyces sp. NPDC126497]|uniref:hypothetical protein n=1 Tax=Streptomyces sp. NPDC126497 TaxID=3155313 RepID=UPI00331A4AC6
MDVPVERTPVARAYVYGGEWVADCPRAGAEPGRAGCGNVEFLYRPSRLRGPRDVEVDFFLCSYCGMQAPVSWPDDRHALLAVLARRPVPNTRNWYPSDHPVALRFGLPHGQSVADLVEENEAHGVR